MPPNPIDVYLQSVLDALGSDLHLTHATAPRVRVDGSLRALATAPLTGAAVRSLIEPIMDPAVRGAWDGGRRSVDFAYDAGPLGRFRVAAFVQRGEVAAVLRRIPPTVPTADQINLPQAARDFALLRDGLVLITGATGEGKSTTLAALIDEVNRARDAHVITIEDPVEFEHASLRSVITHREIGRDVETFPDALRAAVRQDPDVIVVGEVRDEETLRLILRAAETGHLVLGTLHAISAAKAVARVVGLATANHRDQVRVQLAEVLRGVVAQRLVPAVGGGRVAAFEILLNRNAVPRTIEENNLAEMVNAMETRQDGMQTLERALAALVLSGRITADAAAAHANDARGLEREMRKLRPHP